MIARVLRAPLLLCIWLAACRGAGEVEAALSPAVAAARRCITRAGDRVVEVAVTVARPALPRAAAVAILAVQPDGERVELEQVFRDGDVLYRARSHYPPPGPARRTVLVDADGRVLERAYAIDWATAEADFALAAAALRRALATDGTYADEDVRLQLVQGDGDREWLRADVGAPPQGRVVDCDRAGTVRADCRLQWRVAPVEAAPARR